MRILIAALLGAIAMFIWTAIAHMVTPLGSMGISQIPNETPVLAAMHDSIGDKNGLYFFPWVDPKDPQMMQKMDAAMKANPSGLLLYHPPGHGVTDMAGPMIAEFLKEVLQALIAAFLVSLAVISTYWGRVGFVTLIGVVAAITTNVSYWIWYGFPADFSLAAVFIEFVDYIAAGLAIAWWLGRKSARTAGIVTTATG